MRTRRKLWRPIRMDRYILMEVIGPFLGGILFFTFVFLMFQILRLADFLIVHNIPAMLVGKMAALLVLSFLPIALPVAFLISILVAFGRLSSDSELVAMKATGVGLGRLSAAPFALAGVVIVLSLALNLTWVPWGERTLKQTIVKVGNTKIASSLTEGAFTTGFFDLLVYADKVDSRTNRMQRVFLYDEREPKNPLTVVAREGEILPVRSSDDPGGQKLGASAILQLYDGNIHRSDPASDEYQRIDFSEYQLYLKVFEGDDGFVLKAKTLPLDLLMDERSKLKRGEPKFNELNTELWRRISVAMSAIAFVFLGIGFGTARTRSVRAGAALVSFLVLLFYWVIQIISSSFGQKGILPAEFAMQLPNLILLAVGVVSFKKAAW